MIGVAVSDDEDSHSFNFNKSVNMITIERMIDSTQKSHT